MMLAGEIAWLCQQDEFFTCSSLYPVLLASNILYFVDHDTVVRSDFPFQDIILVAA